MPDVPFSEAWVRLRRCRPSHEGAYATESVASQSGGKEILIGVDSRSDLHLLIPVDGAGDGQRPPDLQGLRVRHQVFSGDSHYLDLSAGGAHERLFGPLAADVIRAVVDEKREPWKAVNATVLAWRSAWKPVALQMTKTTQVGLFGELLTLERIMLPAVGPQVVHLWSGPESERHDFVGDDVHLEVKTTRKSRHEHEISRVDQLDLPDGRRLLLVSIQLEQSLAGTHTVASKMDDVVELIRSDPAATDAFMTKMVQLGWTEELRRTGQLLRFEIRDSLIFEVDGAFPRLPPGFELPQGVVAIRYSIDLANVPSISVDETIEILRERSNPMV